MQAHRTPLSGRSIAIAIAIASSWALGALAQSPEDPPPPAGEPPPGEGRSPVAARRGPGGPPGGFGGVRPKFELVNQFDKDGDGRLDAAERKAAREFLAKERAAGRGPRGFGGGGGFGGLGGMLAPQILAQADRDGDKRLTKEELVALAGAWFDRLDPAAAGKLGEEELAQRLGEVLPPPDGFGGGPPSGPGRRFGPGRFLAPALFSAADADRDGSLTRSDLRETFEKWFSQWDSQESGSLGEEELREGLDAVLPRPRFGRRGGPAGPGGERGPPGGRFGGRGESREPPQPGPKLSPADVQWYPGAPLYDPSVLRTFFLEFENADWERELADFKGTDVEVPAKVTVDGRTYLDVGVHFRGMSSFGMVGEGRKRSLKPLLSRLLAVPALKRRYLGYVADIAARWLDWQRLGPLAERYQAIIADGVKADTRKLYSTEAFLRGVSEDVEEPGSRGPRRTVSLKSFAEGRRAFLLDHPEVKKVAAHVTPPG